MSRDSCSAHYLIAYSTISGHTCGVVSYTCACIGPAEGLSGQEGQRRTINPKDNQPVENNPERGEYICRVN